MEPKETSSRLAGLSPAKRALLERRMRGEAQGPKAAGIGRREGTGPAPLSFSQQRLWFLDQLEPGSPTYNLRVLLRLSGPLHREALGRSFQEVARRHEVLRTAFQVADGVPVQAVLPWLELPLPWIDLTALPERERQGESLRQAQALADRSFDLSRPPLVRLALFDVGAGAHHLLVVMHHIVSDGWSTGVLVREVGALYNAFVVYAPSPLPELPIQYGDFAVWQRGWLAGGVTGGGTGGVKEQHLGYWRERLAGAPAGLDLPTDRPRPAVQSFRGATHRFEVGAALTEALTALARREGMTPFMVLAAGLFSLLSRLSGEDDLTIGTPIANRNRPEVEGLIGFFVNTLVLRAGAGQRRHRDILGLLHHVREVTLGAYAHQDLPFEELVAELHPDRDLSRTPLFQVALAHENAPPLGSALAGVELAPVELPVGSAKFDLAFILRGDGETLAGTLEYATDLYDGATAARLCDHWLRLLAAAVADPALEPAAIELLSPPERQQLLREWNDTRAATTGGDVLLHQPFEARVDLHPDAEAATWEGESLTYEQLEERSNRLANLLQRLGAGPASPVAVWMERSLDMVTALLGASKAGATYLPIDAGWPAERAEAVLAGTGAAFVLTRRAHLPAVRELQWRLPRLADAVCLDVDTPAPPPEPLDAAAVRGLFDVVADRAEDWVNDWVTAAGFVSSYTGEAFAEADVLEYRDRVLALAEPWIGAGSQGKRVLEIGAGSGLILWELAPRVGHYVGIDPSPRTQQRNRERAVREGRANVDFPTGFAHEIADLAETPPESFDLVILASTIQFFPGLAYLERVLELALSRLAPGGALVVADVMDPRRREDFRRSLAAYAAAHPGSAAAARTGATGEGRLYVDEDFFADLFPGATAVHPREAGFANELGFRYDVVIRKAEASSKAADRSRRRKRVWTGWHAASSSSARPLPGTSPVDIAYVIHTSGSTGAPKGIVVQHRPAVELCRWINSTFGVGPGDRLLFITSPAFDLSVYDVFGVLAAGGVVHVASEAALRDPLELVRLLVEEPVTIWDSAPAALQQLAPLLPAAPESHEARLRLVLLSGDWIPVPLPDVVRAAFPGARVISLGGATEATVWSNWYPIGEVDPRWPSIPYGRPITNARYHVLDATLQPCAIGVPGDLYIGGDCLCVGYARLPEMTAERFIPDPFAGEPGARLYGTGDRARYGRDGNLEFLGRVDQQVKVRGYRIELEEIEAVLARHPGVREAAVVAREDIPGDKRLVGYFVPLAEPGPTSAELRAALQQVMPEYMVPWTFVGLERMPITANGKLDRKALPAPQEVAEPGAEHVAPRTDLERAVAGVWQEVLRLPRVGVNDDFFELGGSSLLATQVISRIRQACGVELPLRALFEARTLVEMAKRVESLQGGPGTAAPPLTPVPRTGPLPLSFAQQRLWFLDQLVPGSPLYNIPGALRLTGALDAALLGRVLAEVARRHEVLRTTFRIEGGEPAQVIAAAPRMPLPLVDLAGLPAGRRQEELERRTAAEARLPFDLATGPLLRAALLRLGPEEHVVLITLHHIVADAWSMEVFAREIGALYGAWSQEPSGRRLPSPLPELPLQYADYAVWQRRWLTGEVLEAELEHWRRQLAGAPRILELPADRPRPAVQSYRGSSRPFVLPAGLGAALTARAQRRGATLFMALLGAFATVLGRYAAREDVVVGSPVAGRDRPEIEGLIGFFVNTLVLRVDLSGDPGFDGLLDRVRAMALDAFAHQSLPFERLVDELAPVRDPSHSPLFQVAFAFQAAPREPLRLPGLTLEPLHDDSGTAKVDLLLSVTETGSEVSGLWEYSTDLFDDVTIDRWSGHLASVLGTVAEGGGDRLSALPLLAPAERHQLLTEWNDTRDAVDGDATLDRLFTGMAGQWPDRVAVSFEDHSVTYRELAARAGRLARTLRAMGVEPEDLVGICAEEGIERVVGVVGTVLAGGAFLPLDPAHPRERLELMAEDARIRVLLTQEHLRPASPAAAAAVVCLDDYVRRPQGPVPLGSLPWGPVPDNLSYVIYTSGSTGRPNGVQVNHRSAVHLLRLAARHTGADERSRVLQLVSFSFDASVLETWLAFSTGGTLCVVGQETRLSGPALAETIRREGITTMALPPPILATIPHEGLPSLRTILVGGDRCSADLANRWAPPGSSLRLLNCYGPTETTIYSGFQRCAGPYRRDPSIGRPIANLHMVVLDPRGRLAPVGVPGELCVGGAGTVRGYLHRPDLTAQRFVPDSFSAEPGGRLYRSGDLVRLLPNGEIEFLGRVDRQVKLRGLRIELGEIETLLAEHPAVRECAVVVREDAPGEKTLAAYVVPRTEPAPEAPPASDLRGFLAAKLPSYMVPTAFVTLAAFPLSPTGKVDHAALPAPSRERSGRDAVAARNQAEATLAGIWSQVLGVEKVGIHDNFFDLGGDSILCIQVVSRAQQEGLWLTARDLFRHQTVAELAALAATAAAATGGGPGASVEEAGAEVPLTPVQRLFFDMDLEDRHHFNQAVLLALQQKADPGRLERALGAVAALHSALRYRYVRDGEGQWRQVSTDQAAPLAVLDLSVLPQARRRAALEAAAAQLQPSLDLTRGPLLRAALFELGEEGQRLLLVLHHLIVDGVSWRILLGDLETAYRSLAAGGNPELPPVATPFARWAAKLAEHAGSTAVTEELSYWLAPARAAVLPLPVDFPGETGDDTLATAGSVIAELDPEATRALLHDVPKAYHTQINDVLLTALAEAFAGWTGRPHLLVALEGHGREELFDGFDVSRTVGWFTSLFPALLQLPDSDSAAAHPGDHLKAIKEQLRAVPRGGIGYGLLRYAGEDGAAARLREMPPAEVVFNYLGQLDRGLAGSALFAPAGESSGPALSLRQKRGHLLEINGGIVSTEAGSRLRLTWTYGVHRHDRRTIQALADRFIASLRGLIEHCRAKESGDFTPSDFPEARFSQKDLDTLMARIGKRSPGAGARRTGPR